MDILSLRTLGELTVFRNGKPVPLPSSKKTRALLAFLALTAKPQRRDRLCEVFWDIPDDPRGALRWALSKIRPIVNDPDRERLLADRERVTLDTVDIDIDIRGIEQSLFTSNLKLGFLEDIASQLEEPLLEGIDLPDLGLFQQWIIAERVELDHLRARLFSRLARHTGLPPDKALAWTRKWLDHEPYQTEAATLLLTQLDQLGQERDRLEAERELSERFHQAGIAWRADIRINRLPGPVSDPVPATPNKYRMRQKIHFCTAADGVRIAYAEIGEGPPIVKAANWLSHLELDWDAPIWSPLFRELAQDHHFVRYDERGNGLSDWNIRTISFSAFMDDLETVVDAIGLDRFPLLGISQGAAVSIEYAVRHPERVSHLILFGGYPAGWRIGASEETTLEREAVITLTRTGWGKDNPAYRQIFSSTFMPSATAEELSWFNEFQRRTTSPENAARFLSAFGDIDVRHRLAEVKVQTLVIHSLGDRRIPVETGRDIAASIPNAEFLGLESDGHLLLGRETASQVFVDAVREFLSRS